LAGLVRLPETRTRRGRPRSPSCRAATPTSPPSPCSSAPQASRRGPGRRPAAWM